MQRKKIIMAGCMAGAFLLAGCSNMNVVGTGNTESAEATATVASTLDPSATGDKSRILAEAEKLGITGECYESYTSREDDPDPSAVNHGADYYVMIYDDNGDTYYGAVIDGQVKIWSADEKYDTDGVDPSKYDGNVVIKLNVPDHFHNDVKLTFWCYGTSEDADITTAEITLTEKDDYTAGLTVPDGDCNLFDYAISDNDNDTFYVEKDTFTATDVQSIVTFNVLSVADSASGEGRSESQ